MVTKQQSVGGSIVQRYQQLETFKCSFPGLSFRGVRATHHQRQRLLHLQLVLQRLQVSV